MHPQTLGGDTRNKEETESSGKSESPPLDSLSATARKSGAAAQRLNENQLATNRVSQLESELMDARQEAQRMSELRKSDVTRLENNLRINDLDKNAKDATIAELRNTIEQLKNRSSSSNDVVSPSSNSQPESPDPDLQWPNLEGFKPVRYKQDVARRLYNVAMDRRLSKAGSSADVQVNFTIEKDGRPSNIRLHTDSPDDEVGIKSIGYIWAAGPFKPPSPLPSRLVGIDIRSGPRNSGQ